MWFRFKPASNLYLTQRAESWSTQCIGTNDNARVTQPPPLNKLNMHCRVQAELTNVSAQSDTCVINMPSRAEMFSWSSLQLVSSGCFTGSEHQQKWSDAQTLVASYCGFTPLTSMECRENNWPFISLKMHCWIFENRKLKFHGQH